MLRLKKGLKGSYIPIYKKYFKKNIYINKKEMKNKF